MKTVFVIIILISCAVGAAQSKKYKAFLDSYNKDVNPYFMDYEQSSFLSSGLADKELDLLNVDNDLLNATVFFTINKYRKKKKRTQLKYSEELDKCASSYATYYSSNSFKRTEGNKRKLLKSAKYAVNKFGFTGSFVEVIFSQKAMLDKTKFGVFYHDGKATRAKGDDLGIYYGKRPSRNDTTAQASIELYTYKTFAEDLVSQWFKRYNGRITKSRALTLASCYVLLDPQTLFNSKMPSAKAVFVLGGNRTALLPDEPKESKKQVKNTE